MIKANFGIQGVLDNFNQIGNRSRDLRPVLQIILGTSNNNNPNTIIGGIGSQFITQGGMFGPGWKALNKTYEPWKAKKYPGKTMLIRSGAMFSAATTIGAKGNVRILQWNRLTFGIDTSSAGIPYAGAQQMGNKKGTLSPRPYLGVTAQQKEKWKALLKAYMTTGRTGGL